MLTDRALGRATLARQLLLDRVDRPAAEVVHRLVGLQAQNPLDPYLGLWSRISDFDPHEVGGLVEARQLVRIVVMRGTIHLVTADDALALRPVVQPVLVAELARHSQYAPLLVGVDLDPVLPVAHRLLSEVPRSGGALRAVLEEQFPDLPADALAYACRCLLPLVQVPPRGVWGRTLQVTSTPLDTWVGRPLTEGLSIDDVVLRYLRAFGPATVADIASWSRLTGQREVVERLRPQLRTFRDERGRELVDVEDGLLPDEDVSAPVRFLPEYDNVLLSHADRSRFDAGAGSAVLGSATGPVRGTVLVDGTVQAVWHSEVDRRTDHAAVVVEHLPLPARRVRELLAEGARMADFWHHAVAAREVRLVPLG